MLKADWKTILPADRVRSSIKRVLADFPYGRTFPHDKTTKHYKVQICFAIEISGQSNTKYRDQCTFVLDVLLIPCF